VNLTGPILLTRKLLPLLRSGRNPLVVMITSAYALLPATFAPTYSATKAGLRSFTMALRRQLRGVGIRVVEVLPPLVDTPATRSVKKPKMPPATLVDQVLREIARGRDEILPGKVRFLPVLMRLAPSLTARAVAGPCGVGKCCERFGARGFSIVRPPCSPDRDEPTRFVN
jgi:uncharacterized oxidoreductase